MHHEKLFWDEAQRLTLLGLLLENVGVKTLTSAVSTVDSLSAAFRFLAAPLPRCPARQ